MYSNLRRYQPDLRDPKGRLQSASPQADTELQGYRGNDKRTPGLADVDTCTLMRGEADESIRVAAATAAGRLQRYRDLTNEAADSLRAGVLAALDDLDRTAARAR